MRTYEVSETETLLDRLDRVGQAVVNRADLIAELKSRDRQAKDELKTLTSPFDIAAERAIISDITKLLRQVQTGGETWRVWSSEMAPSGLGVASV